MSEAPVSPGTRAAILLISGDASVRDDPKRRRELASAVFSSALSNQWKLNETCDLETFGKFLLCVLHDPWSEIRKESARSLAKWSKSLSQEFCVHAFNLLLVHLKDTEQWQVTHGNILGIAALSAHIDPETDKSILQRVKEYCLSGLSHNTLFVRESARQCFSSLFMQMDVVADLESMVGKYVTADNANHSEAHSFSLQSFLDCLGDYLKTHRSEFLQAIRNSSLSATPSASGLHQSQSLQLVEACMGHLSSTVRFAAATLLTSIFFSCEASAEHDIADYVVNLICTAVDDRSTDDWRRREGYLIAAHDMLQSSATTYLHAVCCGVLSGCDTVPSSQKSALRRLIRSLRWGLPSILQDRSSFELRRIAAQMLPPLVRCSLFCTVYDRMAAQSADTSGGEASADYDISSDVQLSVFGEHNPAGSECTDLDENIFVFCFAAEVAKAIKLLLEAISAATASDCESSSLPDATALVAANSNHIATYKHKSHGAEHLDISWAMIVPRRLGEEDTRLHIWSEILAGGKSEKYSALCCVGEMLLEIFERRTIPAVLKCSAKFCATDGEFRSILSADVIEGIFLCAGVCKCLDNIGDSVQFDMSSALNYAIRLVSLTQVFVASLPIKPDSNGLIAMAMETMLSGICGGVTELEFSSGDNEVLKRSSVPDLVCKVSVTDPTGPAGIICSQPRARRGSYTAKYAQIDKWVCEAVSPVLAASAHILTDENLFVLVVACLLWLERIYSDSQWLSIKATAKKTVSDFIASAILRMEIIESTGCNPGISTNVVHAILRASLPVLKISFSKEDHSVAALLVKLCRVAHSVVALFFETGSAEPVQAMIQNSFEAIISEVKDYHSRLNTPVVSITQDETTTAARDDVEIDVDAIVVDVAKSDCEDDSFSDWDESEDEDTALFQGNNGSVSQKLFRKNSSVYLSEELELLLTRTE